MKIIEKGWSVDLSMIDEGYLCSQISCNAPTKNKAKSKLLPETKYLVNRYGEEITYLNIPIFRDNTVDLVEFQDEVMQRFKAENLIQSYKHLDELNTILNDPKIEYCYIIKRGSYYGDNYCGYTEYKYKAGIYPKEDAVRHCRGCNELSLISIDIQEHNTYIQKHIEELKKKIIK